MTEARDFAEHSGVLWRHGANLGENEDPETQIPGVPSISNISRESNLSRKPPEIQGKRIRFLERTMVEKNGESTPRQIRFSITSKRLLTPWASRYEVASSLGPSSFLVVVFFSLHAADCRNA